MTGQNPPLAIGQLRHAESTRVWRGVVGAAGARAGLGRVGEADVTNRAAQASSGTACVWRGVVSPDIPQPANLTGGCNESERNKKPGITGLWQVSGRSDVDFDDRLRLDIEYIRKRSVWFDLKLLYHTIAAVVKPRGAY